MIRQLTVLGFILLGAAAFAWGNFVSTQSSVSLILACLLSVAFLLGAWEVFILGTKEAVSNPKLRSSQATLVIESGSHALLNNSHQFPTLWLPVPNDSLRQPVSEWIEKATQDCTFRIYYQSLNLIESTSGSIVLVKADLEALDLERLRALEGAGIILASWNDLPKRLNSIQSTIRHYELCNRLSTKRRLEANAGKLASEYRKSLMHNFS